MARRVGTLDPVLAELRSELRDRLPALPAMLARDIDRRQQMRVQVACAARLRIDALAFGGSVLDVAAGGLFLQSLVLVEAGERGELVVDGVEPVPVRVVWTRGSAHPRGGGIALAFEVRDRREERRALELVLAVLDAAA